MLVNGQERFWRNIFGGLSSSRFHPPTSGLGLSQIAQAHIRSLRAVTDAIDIFTCEPHNDLISERSWNEAYCTAHPGVEYAVFFPDGGNVLLDVGAAEGIKLRVRWMEIRRSEWSRDEVVETGKTLRLETPTEEGYWAAVVEVN